MSAAAYVSRTKDCLKQVDVGGCYASQHDRSDLFSIYVFIYLDMYHVVGEFGGSSGEL